MSSNIATERKPREFWINVFHDQYTHHQIAHNSREVADACAKTDSEHRVDCIHVREIVPSASVETKTETQLEEAFGEADQIREDSGKQESSSNHVAAVLQNALEPFARLAGIFDVEPYAKDYPNELKLRDSDTIAYHNFLTLGHCRNAKAALKLLSEHGGGSLAVGASSQNPPCFNRTGLR